MRPASKGPLESLYFTYPTFRAARALELDGSSVQHPVVIAGAGPIGMTAALTLARYGVKSVLLDRKNTFNDGSRAICIARPSMQILERIGAVQPFLEKALGWRYGRSYYRGQQIYRLEMPHTDDDKYLPMYNLQQQYIEQYLHDAVVRSPLIDMRWQSDVTDVAQDDTGATISVASPHGAYCLRAEYVLAADGARSPIRSRLGLRLQGANYEGRYVIADVRMVHDFPTERRAYFGSTAVPGGTVLIHKQPDDIWRIDYQLAANERDEEATFEPTLRARVQAILNEIGHTGTWDLEWWSIYQANTLALDDYRHGRVVFIGDSAHIVPIFGVRGLNNGLADAHNIGWKLGYVLQGHADHKLLDSYSPERRSATLDVFANATKSTRFMTPATRGWELMREAALSLSLTEAFPRNFANPRQMQPHTYADSPLFAAQTSEAEFVAGPTCGAFAPDLRLSNGTYLLDHAGDGFTLIIFGAETFVGLQHLTSRDPFLATVSVEITDAAVHRYDARPGTVYLLRPDLHVAGRWRAFDTSAVTRTLEASLGRSP